MIMPMILLCLVTQIKEINPDKKITIEIVTTKTQQYYLLTKAMPVYFTIEGPTYVRVYTRAIWPSNATGTDVYKVVLQENEIDEEIISFESEPSHVTTDEMGRRVSKWRTFYINVPDGLNYYKITHWSSPMDTILLRFKYEAPKQWIAIPALTSDAVVQTIEEEQIIKYYLLKNPGKVSLQIQGPKRIKIISRLNYNEKLIGQQNYSLLAKYDDKEEIFPLKCYKSETIIYKDRKDILPANARTSYLSIGNGFHTINFSLSGTLAPSAALRFLIEEE